MSSKPIKPMSKAQKNAQDCREIYEEISFLKECLNWTLQDLCEKTRVELHPDCDLDSDKKETERWYQRIKKIFSRGNWDSGKVNETTLATLVELKRGIFLTDDYRESELYESSIPLSRRKMLREQSKELDRQLRKDYREEE